MLAALKWVFTPCAVLALLSVTWRYREELAQTAAEANTELLLLAIALWCLMHALSPLFVYLIVAGDGVSLRTVYRIHLKNIPARYIPGGIWGTVGRVADLAASGARRGTLVTFVGLENFAGLTMASALGALMLISTRGWWAMEGSAGVIFLLCGAAVLAAPLAARLPAVRGHWTAVGVPYVRAMTVVAASWIVAALSFTAYYASVTPARSDISVVDVAGAYLISWAAGFVAVFAPQGIGVFEVVASSLLKGSSPLAQTAVLFAGFRVVILLADLLVWSCVRPLMRTE